MSEIKSRPNSPEFERNYDAAMRRDTMTADRPPGTEPCEWCGRVMRYADQRCGCTTRSKGR